MTTDTICSDCGGTMQTGYIPDYVYGGGTLASWVEGHFERNLLGFPKFSGRKKYYLVAYRCEKCGLIKLYAPSTQTVSNKPK